MIAVRQVPRIHGNRLGWELEAADWPARMVLAWGEVQTSAPGRLRACANDECHLFLLDRSRGGNGRWCSMSECGNRMKARRHYSRAATSPARSVGDVALAPGTWPAPLLHAIRISNKFLLNPIMGALAGRKNSYAAVIRRTGRKSGKQFSTAVGADRVAGGSSFCWAKAIGWIGYRTYWPPVGRHWWPRARPTT